MASGLSPSDVASTTCHLCGLPVLGRPVRDRDADFCCEGCRRVNEVAAEAGIELTTATSRAARAADAARRKAEAAGAAGARRDTLRLDGMWCASCSLVLEDALMGVPGVLDAEVSYAASLARVTRLPELASEDAVLERVRKLGYGAKPAREAASGASDTADLFLRFFVAAAVGMWVSWPTWLVVWPSAVARGWGAERPLESFTAAMSLIVLVYCGWPFLVGAWRAARVGRATMDTLVVVGTWTSWLYSAYALRAGGPTYFDSAAMITMIVLLGRWLEALGTRDTRGTLTALSRLGGGHTWYVDATDDSIEQRAADAVSPGDVVVVRPGERLPVDGIVLEGVSEVDRARLTGEPMPAPVAEGDEVFAGSVNLSGQLRVRVTRAGGDTLAGRLAALVEDAAFAKSHVQRVADAISAVFVPGVLALAAMTALGTLAGGLGAAVAASRAVAVLVVACPCALGLATPLAISNAVGAAARMGAVLRGGPVLEHAGAIATVAFDKTGTLTTGMPAFIGLIADKNADLEEILALATAIEAGETHPVAVALTAVGAGSQPDSSDPAVVERHPGRGLVGEAEGRSLVLGSEALLAETGYEVPAGRRVEAEAARGRGELVVWLAGIEEAPIGLRFADAPRPESAEVVRLLHEGGMRTAMLSGDSQTTCDAVAAAIGVDHARGAVMPHEKEAALYELAEQGPVAFVGDGINDAAALTAADLSVSIESGSEVAVLASDVVLLGAVAERPLTSLPRVLRLARRARRIIRENLAWAFSYNLVALPLAVSGRLSPVWAAAAMAGSSLAVVANSLRLRRAR